MKHPFIFKMKPLLILSCILLSQCRKINDTEINDPLTVVDISPAGGKSGTPVIIKGSGFSLILNEDTVKFNGKIAQIKKATDTTIEVTAPQGGTTGKVTITVRNKSVEGPIFTYLKEDHPQITGISPETGWDYTLNEVTITGKSFGDNKSKVSITFDGIAASLQSFSSTKLIVNPPKHATGKVNIVVKVNGNTSNIVQYIYQIKPEIHHIYKHQKGNKVFYFLAVSNLDANNAVIKAIVNGHVVKIDAIYRKGSDEYQIEPKGDKIGLKESDADQFVSSFYADFTVSSNNVESAPAHFENDPVITNVTSAENEAYHFSGGDTITVTGKYFSPDAKNASIELWTKSIPVSRLPPDPKVLSWSNTKIKIVVPDYKFNYDEQIKAVVLKLWVRTNGQSVHNDNIDVAFEIKKQQAGDYMVSTFAGSTAGYKDGNGAEAQFNGLGYLAIDSKGNIYAPDRFNHRIRKITPAGDVSTFAGDGVSGHKDGSAAQAEFYLPTGVAVDNNDDIFVCSDGAVIRKITQAGTVSTLIPASRIVYYGWGLDIDQHDNLYMTDSHIPRVSKITSAGTIGIVAGSNQQGYKDAEAQLARFSQLSGILVDKKGDVYVSDGSSMIRKITFNHNPAVSLPAVVTTVAGKYGEQGYEDGNSLTARFYSIYSLAEDKEGNIYIADGHRIRKWNTASGMITTIAGGDPGYADGPGKDAKFNRIFGIVIDPQRNILYVADDGNNRIRKIILK